MFKEIWNLKAEMQERVDKRDQVLEVQADGVEGMHAVGEQGWT